MGCLHWTYDVVQRQDVNAITLALEGHTDLLIAIFGKKEDERPRRKMTSEGFKAFAASHNRRYAKPRSHRGGAPESE